MQPYEAAGNIEYYTDESNNYYKLENGVYTQINQEDTVLPKLEQPSMQIVAVGSKYDVNVFIQIAEGAQLSDYTVRMRGTQYDNSRHAILSAGCIMFSNYPDP